MAEETKPTAKPEEITLDAVQKFLAENDDAIQWMNSQKDSAVTKGVSTYKTTFMEKEFPGLLETEVEKRLPAPETDEAKRLKELEIKFQQADKDKIRVNLINSLLKIANEEKIPNFFVDYAIAADEETSTTNLRTLGKKYIDDVNAAVEERLKGKGRPAPGSGKEEDNVTLSSLKTMTNMEDLEKNKASIEAMLKDAQSQE